MKTLIQEYSDEQIRYIKENFNNAFIENHHIKWEDVKPNNSILGQIKQVA